MGCLGMVYRYGSKCTGIPEPTQGAKLFLSLSLSLSLSRTHMHARACTHARTHTLCTHSPPPPSDISFSLLLCTRHLVFLPSLSLCLLLLPICPWQRNKEPSKPGVEVKLFTVAIDIRRERANHCSIVYSGIPVQNTGSGMKYRYGYPYRYPALAVNRLQHVCLSGPNAVLCKSHATHQALITCNMSCYMPHGTKGQLSY